MGIFGTTWKMHAETTIIHVLVSFLITDWFNHHVLIMFALAYTNLT